VPRLARINLNKRIGKRETLEELPRRKKIIHVVELKRKIALCVDRDLARFAHIRRSAAASGSPQIIEKPAPRKGRKRKGRGKKIGTMIVLTPATRAKKKSLVRTPQASKPYGEMAAATETSIYWSGGSTLQGKKTVSI